MMNKMLPFRFIPVEPRTVDALHDGHVISTFDCCGMFLCTGGEVEILFGEQSYRLRRGDMYIYVPSTIVRLLHRSEDAQGIMVEIELSFVLPLATGTLSVENLLNLRHAPCITLGEAEFRHLLTLAESLKQRIEQADLESLPMQRRILMQDILRSMAQTIFYEVVNLYYVNRPLAPLPQGKKELVFHHFMISLFQNYRTEREVAFYATQQHIDSRYFSTIIKEKSGSTPQQWIVQMVITEARQLLESSDLSIKEIAAKLNFPTQSFFGKYFKQYVGLSPKAYRQRI